MSRGVILRAGAGATALPAGQESRRVLVRAHEGLGPWGGRVTVTAVLMAGRLSGHLGAGKQYEVTATWTGPSRAPGAVAGEVVATQDSVWLDELAAAEAVARVAAEQLRAPRIPELEQLAARARRERGA